MPRAMLSVPMTVMSMVVLLGVCPLGTRAITVHMRTLTAGDPWADEM